MISDKTALLGDIGRSGVTFALTDRAGDLNEASIRSYEAGRHNTISGALMAFKEESGLPNLPRRCALAVAGVPRGDTISITSSRWFISRSGLTAILQRPPLVINDFAANVWSISAADEAQIIAVGATAPSSGPGTFAVIGMSDGLGVGVLIRDESGTVTVLPTEAGHSELIDQSAEAGPILDIIRSHHRYCSAETLLSPAGLVAIRNAISEQRRSGEPFQDAEQVVHAASLGDPEAVEAARIFSKALWRFAGNLTLIYGAWDGIFLSGALVASLRSTLCDQDVRQSFVISGPNANLLRKVPCGFFLLEHSGLRGAAEAIRHQS
jgi:glucokinase